MRLRLRLLPLALLGSLTIGAPAWAQLTPPERSAYSPAAYYRYEDAGDLTIRVQAWGNLRYPGLHEIAQGSRLSRLLSLAGGPALAERRLEDRRRIVVQLYRPTAGGGSTLVFEKEMRNGIVGFDEDPVLLEGDVLTVDAVVKQGYTWRDYVPVATGAASVVIGLASIIISLTR